MTIQLSGALDVHGLTRRIFDAINVHLAARGLMLREGTVVDATIIAAPSSTKNQEGKRDPEMHQTKKGNQWYFGMKAHIGVDAGSGITHTVVTTPANAADVTQAHALLHGEERLAFGDAGYQGVEKREENRASPVTWHVALRPGKRRALPDTDLGRLDESIETAQDFLNFGGIAKTVAEIIEQAQSRPISIGVSGAWGVGKSSVIKLIRTELSDRPTEKGQAPGTGDMEKPSRFIFVEFNAWLRPLA